jgi:hypothetical protein
MAKTKQPYVTIVAFARELRRHKVSALRIVRRYEAENGKEILSKRRLGGKQRQCILSREDADTIRQWHADFPAQ